MVAVILVAQIPVAIRLDTLLILLVNAVFADCAEKFGRSDQLGTSRQQYVCSVSNLSRKDMT